MSKWTLEVSLLNLMNGERETITDFDAEDNDMVLALCRMHARFTYKGVRYISDPPWVDPIAKKLIYHCEGYPDET